MTVKIARLRPSGSHTSNASLSSAVTLTVPDGASGVLVQAITQNIRYTLDGTVPTASLGFRLTAGDAPIMIPIEGATLKFIQETATATLQYQFVGNV